MIATGLTATVERETGEASVAELVRAASAGERPAWDALLDRLGPMVYAVARSHRLSPADAADVAQTTWLRLIEHLDRLGDPERVGAWLATTARRESLRLLRSARREVPTGEAALTGGVASAETEIGTDPASVVLRKERIAAVQLAFRRLPSRSQFLLTVLMHRAAPSYRELSEELGMPVGSIGPTRQRCLRQLRRLLDDSHTSFRPDPVSTPSR